MKNSFFILFIVALTISSCSKKPETNPVTNTTNIQTPVKETSSNPSELEGNNVAVNLIKGSDCFSCHKEDAKLLGPSWNEIADKYTQADVATLANHIIDGSTGTWGELQMTPHPTLSIDDAKVMVEYIITLKSK